MPIPYRLESFEKSIAILTSMLPKIRTDNYIYQIAHIECILIFIFFDINNIF